MARPAVTTRTELAYAQLPQYLRDGDEQTDYTTLRFISLILDQLERLRGVLANPAAFVNPATAPYEVLPWLAQIYGIDTTLYPDTDGWRTALRQALLKSENALTPGSAGAILAAVTPILVGSRTAEVNSRDVDTLSYVVKVYEREVVDVAVLSSLVETTSPAGLQALLNVAPGQSWGDVAERGITLGQLGNYTNAQIMFTVPRQPIN